MFIEREGRPRAWQVPPDPPKDCPDDRDGGFLQSPLFLVGRWFILGAALLMGIS